MDLVESTDNYIISTNHFQGSPLGETALNKDHMVQSSSLYRYDHVKRLIEKDKKNSIANTAIILRNQRGIDEQEIGMGNEKAINQLIAHHGIIFQPEKQLVWISTAPWQLGKFVCYDLNKIFGMSIDKNHEIYENKLTIAADQFVKTPSYIGYQKFLPYRFPFSLQPDLLPDSLISWNPESYQAYMVAGDYYLDHEAYAKAISMYQLGLAKEIATVQERTHIEKNLYLCQEKLK